jgi:hypothetical protein
MDQARGTASLYKILCRMEHGVLGPETEGIKRDSSKEGWIIQRCEWHGARRPYPHGNTRHKPMRIVPSSGAGMALFSSRGLVVPVHEAPAEQHTCRCSRCVGGIFIFERAPYPIYKQQAVKNQSSTCQIKTGRRVGRQRQHFVFNLASARQVITHHPSWR